MVNWHPLGTIWHPFEGAGNYSYISFKFTFLYIYIFTYTFISILMCPQKNMSMTCLTLKQSMVLEETNNTATTRQFVASNLLRVLGSLFALKKRWGSPRLAWDGVESWSNRKVFMSKLIHVWDVWSLWCTQTKYQSTVRETGPRKLWPFCWLQRQF